MGARGCRPASSASPAPPGRPIQGRGPGQHEEGGGEWNQAGFAQGMGDFCVTPVWPGSLGWGYRDPGDSARLEGFLTAQAVSSAGLQGTPSPRGL